MRLWVGCLALGAAAIVSAAVAPTCRARIIVVPQPEAPRFTDDAALQALGDTARVRLHLIRTIGPKLYLLELSTRADDPDCAAAIARLQADPRLLSVERDVRRQRQGP